jgi:hypothetical protein
LLKTKASYISRRSPVTSRFGVRVKHPETATVLARPNCIWRYNREMARMLTQEHYRVTGKKWRPWLCSQGFELDVLKKLSNIVPADIVDKVVSKLAGKVLIICANSRLALYMSGRIDKF